MKIDHSKLLGRLRENDPLPQAYRVLLDSGCDLTRRRSILDADYCDFLRRAREYWMATENLQWVEASL